MIQGRQDYTYPNEKTCEQQNQQEADNCTCGRDRTLTHIRVEENAQQHSAYQYSDWDTIAPPCYGWGRGNERIGETHRQAEDESDEQTKDCRLARCRGTP